MKNWKRCFIEILILLLIKVPHIQAGCKRDSQKYCTINCVQKNPYSYEKIEPIMELLEEEWTKHPDCQDDGIDLNLELFEYPENIMKANFFTTQWKVRELSISFSTLLAKVRKIEVKSIEVNAFNVNALKSLKKLVLTDLNVSPIKKGIFNGLESLEVLNIKNAKLTVIEEGVLDILNRTLKEFSLEEESSSNEILIDGLTGSGKLEKLENIKFRYELQTSIREKTFAGLTNTKILDLSKCQIKTIGAGAFDPMISLETLKLENNLFTTIPDGFFNTILIRNKTQIFLDGNKWLCDCSLMPFKMSLMEHSNFVGELKCDKPQMFYSHKITDINFCDSTTSATSSPTTSTTSLTTPYAPKQVCTSPEYPEVSEYIVIEPRKQSMEVLKIDDGDIILRADNLKGNGILIWFLMNEPISYFNASIDINCQIGSGTSFLIKNLTINSVYNFCLMEPTKGPLDRPQTISPLDCVSYMLKKSDSHLVPWLLDEKKGHFIAITSVACGLSIVLGLLIGILVHKMKMYLANRNENFIRRNKSSRANSLARSRLSVMTSDSYTTRRTTNTTVQYFLEGNYDAPPLPARPASMYLMDEPVYATIRDFASLRDGTQESVIN